MHNWRVKSQEAHQARLVTFCIELRVQNLIGLQSSMLLQMTSFQYINTAWIWGESGIFPHIILRWRQLHTGIHLVLGRDSFIHIWRVTYYVLIETLPNKNKPIKLLFLDASPIKINYKTSIPGCLTLNISLAWVRLNLPCNSELYTSCNCVVNSSSSFGCTKITAGSASPKNSAQTLYTVPKKARDSQQQGKLVDFSVCFCLLIGKSTPEL